MELDKYVLFKSEMKIHSIYSGYDIAWFLAKKKKILIDLH